MRVVPQLVFVNCCYLGRLVANPVLKYDRAVSRPVLPALSLRLASVAWSLLGGR